MNFKNFLAAFDFDGVIWNSVDECFYMAYKAYMHLRGPIEIDRDRLKSQFRNARYLAKDGNDFFIIMDMLKNDPETDFEKVTRQQFHHMRDKYPNDIRRFTNMFYTYREQMRDVDFARWIGLQKPYEGVLQQLPGVRDAFLDFVICTTKDEPSVKRLLGRHGFECPVFGREVSLHKPDQMELLTGRYNIGYSQIVFVDDLMENLLPVKETGVITAMAAWGYNNSGGRDEARSVGIPIIEKDNLKKELGEVITSFQKA